VTDDPVTVSRSSETASSIARAATSKGQITCARAFAVARRLGISPADLGAEADALGIAVSRCQLGLFGYGSKAEGKSKIVRATELVPAALAAHLAAASEPGGSLTCAELWAVARQARVGRLAAACAAEGLGIRVSVCQLGCFKPRPPVRR
jgi:hypothetical protein